MYIEKKYFFSEINVEINGLQYLLHLCLLSRMAPTCLPEIASDLDQQVLHPQIYCSAQLGRGQKC